MITQQRMWLGGSAFGISLAAGLLGQAEVLQVSGTVSEPFPGNGVVASISGTVDTSGLGTNQVNVQFESLDPGVSRVWYTFEVLRPLLWNGAARMGDTWNYWDKWAGDYGGAIFVPALGVFSVSTSGTLMTYSLQWQSETGQGPSDAVGLQSYDVIWGGMDAARRHRLLGLCDFPTRVRGGLWRDNRRSDRVVAQCATRRGPSDDGDDPAGRARPVEFRVVWVDDSRAERPAVGVDNRRYIASGAAVDSA